MSTRLFAIFFVGAFILAIGGMGGLMGLADDSVPWAAAAAPAGDDDDDDQGPDLTDMDCVDIVFLTWEIFILQDPDGHAPFVNLELLLLAYMLCTADTSGITLQEAIVTGQPFNMEIGPQNPATSKFVMVEGTYDPNTGEFHGEGEGTVANFPNIAVEMDITISHEGEVTGTYAMGVDGDLPPGNGNGNPITYGIEGTIPLTTPTSTPPASGTPGPTNTPGPTDPPGQQVVWGNHNCSGDPLEQPDAVDSLLNLRHDAALSTNTGDCPDMGTQQSLVASNGLLWGDVDCDDAAGPIDSLKVLRFNAGLSVSQGDPCPVMGSLITISPG